MQREQSWRGTSWCWQKSHCWYRTAWQHPQLGNGNSPDWGLHLRVGTSWGLKRKIMNWTVSCHQSINTCTKRRHVWPQINNWLILNKFQTRLIWLKETFLARVSDWLELTIFFTWILTATDPGLGLQGTGFLWSYFPGTWSTWWRSASINSPVDNSRIVVKVD